MSKRGPDEPSPSEAPRTLGAWLKRWREEKQLTQLVVANRAGTSNKTVSEYEKDDYGDGKPPSLSKVARLAFALGQDPREVIAKTSLEYDEGVVEQARRKVQLQSETASSPTPRETTFTSSLEELRAQKAQKKRPIVRVSFIHDVCYHPFDQEHIELLCKFISHDWGVEFVAANSFQEKAKKLEFSTPHRCHVAIGALETLERTASGLKFIPYPGLRQRLNGVIQKEGSSGFNWNTITNNEKGFNILTISDEVGDQYIRGIASYSGDDITSVPHYHLDSLNKKYIELLENRYPGQAVLVAAEHVCQQIIARDQGRLGLRLVEDPSDATANLGILPSYQPGFLVRYEDREWYELLVKAQEFAFQSATERIAKIYADFFVKIMPGLKEGPSFKVDHELSFARLHPIDALKSRDTRECFFRSLETRFEQEIKATFISKADQEELKTYTTQPFLTERRDLRDLVEELLQRLDTNTRELAALRILLPNESVVGSSAQVADTDGSANLARGAKQKSVKRA